MSVYTVHLKGSPQDAAALERAVLVREGFAWSAVVFGPLWLLWNRLWLGFLGFVALEACIVALGGAILSGGQGAFWLQALLHVALGFEAAQIRRRSLTRKGFRLVDVREARNATEAERAFFESAIEPRAAPTARSTTGGPQPGLVGLFPSAGA